MLPSLERTKERQRGFFAIIIISSDIEEGTAYFSQSTQRQPPNAINIINQEIIKVREWIPHIGPLAKVIRLKLFLDIVPSSFADITRALRGCLFGGSVYVSFRFVLKQSKFKASNSVKMSSLIFWLQAKELRCCDTFRTCNRRLNERRMYPAQFITIEWTADKCLDKWQTINTS